MGKPSYAERGVAPEAYAAYFGDYVAPRWREHGGAARLAALGAEAAEPPVVLDALGGLEANAEALAREAARLRGGGDSVLLGRRCEV